MKLTVERFDAEKRRGNVAIASAEGKTPFLTIKGVKIVDDANGPFVSWPARKDDKGKWWPYCYAVEAFNSAVLAAFAEAAKAAKAPAKQQDDEDIPF